MRGASRRAAAGTGLGLAVAWLGLALLLVPAYGLTWDAAIGEYRGGDRLLAYLTSGDAAFLASDAPTPDAATVLGSRQPYPDFPAGGFGLHQISPLNALSAATTNHVVWTKLGWFDAITGFNLSVVLWTALLLAGMGAVVARRFGVATGLGAGILLFASPRFFAHAFNNPKDVPVAALYAIAAWLGMRALRPNARRRSWFVAGAVTGLALASKANAFFLPVQLGLYWLVCTRLPRARDAAVLDLRGVGFAALACALTYAAVSPDVWHGPLDAVTVRYSEIARVAATGSGVQATGILTAWWTTPPVVLVLAAIGLGTRSAPSALRVFLAAGLVVPLGRTLLPDFPNFNGVRHVLEFWPFLACAAALGLRAVLRRVQHVGPRLAIPAAIALLVPALWGTVTTHPDGVCYFNSFAGGLPGARARSIADAGDYWGNSYRRGLGWISQHAERDARLVVPIAPHIAAAAAPVLLRPDIELLTADADRPLDRPTYVLAITQAPQTPFHRAVVATLQPTHTLEVDGAPILTVHRLAPDDSAATTAWNVRREAFTHDVKGALQRLGAWLATQPPETLGAVNLWSQALRDPEHRSAASTELRKLIPDPPIDAAAFEALAWHWSR